MSDHSPAKYVKIWALLLVLLIVSVLGPMLEIRAVTLITAFGIALIKALIVTAYFMHLNIEKKFIHYMLYTMLILLGVFFSGIATDIMKPEGRNWVNTGALTEMERGKVAASQAHGEHE
ncbi:MAG: cytochrome C oxidase subunit IV family protein [Pseudomonadota bacterium]